MDLRFAHYRAGDWTVVTISGEVDIATAPKLAAGLCQLVERDDVGKLLLDLSSVSFLDASGLNAFVQVHNVLAATGERLFLTGLKPHLVRVLRITGLDRTFEVLDASAAIPRQPMARDG